MDTQGTAATKKKIPCAHKAFSPYEIQKYGEPATLCPEAPGFKAESAPYLSSVWLSTLTKMEEVEMVPMEEPSKKDGLAGTRSGRRYDPNTAVEEPFRHMSVIHTHPNCNSSQVEGPPELN